MNICCQFVVVYDEALPYVLAPAAAYAHLMSHYTSYLREKSQTDPETHYINEFETIRAGEANNFDNFDNFAGEKDYVWIDDEEKKREIARQCAEDYLFYNSVEQGNSPPFSPTLLAAQVK